MLHTITLLAPLAALLVLGPALNNGLWLAEQRRSNLSTIERDQIEALVYKIAADSSSFLGPEDVTDEQIKLFNRDAMPILADFVVGGSRDVDFRRRALAILEKLGPDERVLERLGNYIKENAMYYQRILDSGIDMVSPVRRFLFNFYRRTHNEKLLEPYRWVLQEPGCDLICRLDAIQFLMETGSTQNIGLFQTILDDSSSTEAEKGGAAYGIAKAGDERSLVYLITMANYLFDTSLLQGHQVHMLCAFDGLVVLARKNPKVNRVIQDLAVRCSQEMDAKYIYRDTWFGQPASALASVGVVENARFLEQIIIPNCRDQRIVRGAIEALGRFGDQQSIEYLRSLTTLYPETAQQSIKEIRRRIRQQEQ